MSPDNRGSTVLSIDRTFDETSFVIKVLALSLGKSVNPLLLFVLPIDLLKPDTLSTRSI